MNEPRLARHLAMTTGALRAVIVLFLLTLLLGAANLLFTSHEVNTVRSQHQALLYACRLGNQSRAQQVTLWTHIIAISRPPAHETPAQARQRQQTITEFTAYVHKIFAPRDCARIYRLAR